MLCRMQTNDVNDPVPNDLVRAAFEACATFAAEGDGSPVCAACGWLGADHGPDVAPARELSVGRQSIHPTVDPPTVVRRRSIGRRSIDEAA